MARTVTANRCPWPGHARTVLAIGLGALLLVLAAASIALANIAPNATFDAESARSNEPVEHWDEAGLPIPVVGEELFVAPANAPSCKQRDWVVAGFDVDQAEIGGDIFEVSDGRYQKAADAWRERARVDSVAVSGAVAHLFFDRGAEEWIADLVEFDPAGCAMSRTLMPRTTWTELLSLI